MFKPDPACARIGPFWFAPEWSRTNAVTVWGASLLTIGLTAFMSFMQPYLLNEMLHVPKAEQGTLTGTLGAWQETLVILLVGFVGAWSEKVGRRTVYYLGFVALAAGYAVYPLAADTAGLYLCRSIFAIGVAMAPLMLSACIVDAPQEVSRGKWIGSNNVLQGLGVVVMAVLLARAPAWYAAHGAGAVAAGRYTYWTAAAACIGAAALMAAGLPRIVPAGGRRFAGAFQQLTRAAGAAASNPRLILAFGAAFIGRGDFTVVGNFFSLWIMQTGLEQGMSAGTALARGGMLFGITQAAALLWAFFMGMLTDRINRVTALCVALAFASAGYLAMGQVVDPFSAGFVPFAVLLGIGEVSVIVAGGALLGQESANSSRGPIVGLYNAVGGIGILFATFAGGLVFDHLGRTAPFTVIGIFNAALLLAGLLVRMREGN